MTLFQYQIISIEPLRVTSRDGEDSFSGSVASRCSKIYVVRDGRRIVYVGSTTQSLRSRLYGALRANGKNGYHGYGWKTHTGPLSLDVWVLDGIDCVKAKRCLIAETVEAEIVFLVRKHDRNWPPHQTEIHFHHSSARERAWAKRIYESASKRRP
jgi:hypothetical protein